MCAQAAKMLKKMLMVILMIIAFTTKESSTQDDCTHGDVRLVGTPLSSFGVVEVCINSRWGRVCRDRWDDDDAAVVCNELGFGRDGALALLEVPVEDSNFMHRSFVIDEVYCASSATKLLNCRYSIIRNDDWRCRYGGDAGVRCKDKWLQVKNITAATIQASYNNITRQSTLISWELYNNASYRPSSFLVECFNQQHHRELSMNDWTLTQVNIGDIFSSTIFACCVSAIYYHGHYVTEQRCTAADSDMLLFTIPAPNQTPNQPFTTPSSTPVMPASIGSENVVGSDLNMKANIVGGVLGSIIIILLLLLAMCGGALLFLLRSRSMTKKSSTEMAIKRNVSYLTTALTASGEVQASDTVDHTPGAATEYSRIGPSYETITNSNHSRRQQPVAGVSAARLSERYEFSEPHRLAAMICGGTQGNEAAVAMDYEVPLQSGQHEEYSHLQH